MDEFCGDIKHAWGPTAKGYLTHCFDDVVLFGLTYVYIFVVGSYRVWTLLRVPTAKNFPYSNRHSVKVMVLGWLGMMPMVIFTFRYAQGTHDDFEWVSKPLASLAWLFSLWILNMEVARDLRECWVLRSFWLISAVAATVALPTAVLQAEVKGYGIALYASILHYILYLVIAAMGIRWRHVSKNLPPEWSEEVGHHFVGSSPQKGGASGAASEGAGDAGATPVPHIGFMTTEWWDHAYRLLSLYAPEKLILGGALFSLLIAVPLSALSAVVVGRLFNNFYYPYAPDSSRGHLREYCLVIVGIYILSCGLEALYTTLVFISGEKMASRTRRKLLHAILRQDMEFFDQTQHEDLVQTIKNDVGVVVRSTGLHLFHGVHCILNVLLCVSVMFIISWKMSLVVLSLAPICVLVINVQRHFTLKLARDRRECLGRAGAHMWESLQHMRVVRAFAAEESQVEDYRKCIGDVYDLSFQSGLLDSTSKSAVTLTVQFAIVLMLYVGGVVVLSRQMEVGYLVTFVILSILAISSVGQVPKLVSQFASALRASNRIFDLLDRIPEMNTKATQVIEELQGRLQFDQVSFSYASEPMREVLSGCSFSIEANSIVAILGRRGSGKSSLVALMQRMYDASAGAVLLDGQDVRGLDVTWLRENLAVVLEDPVIFCQSIAQNIAYSLDTATQSQVEAAARFALAHEFIQTFPDGYQALVGDRGVRLTASQKLQIALARAVLSHPRVLVLDETISGLDGATADAVMDNLMSTVTNRTTIILTSHVESVARIDRVLELDGGRVVEGEAGQRAGGGSRGGAVEKGAIDMVDSLERRMMQLEMPQGKVMELVDMVGEVREALMLESDEHAGM